MTLKAPVKPLLPELQKEARAAVEKFAAAELNCDTVRIRMYEAARNGQTSLRLRLPAACTIDMRHTEAAHALKEWCKMNGFSMEWETRSVIAEDGRTVVIGEPEISWPSSQG
jgi:hypothetical protein